LIANAAHDARRLVSCRSALREPKYAAVLELRKASRGGALTGDSDKTH